MDDLVKAAAQSHSGSVYALLFLIMFCQTGVVLTPFLPGDILLFLAGAYARRGCMNVWVVLVVFMVAALSGDSANYWFGMYVGPKLFKNENSRLFKKAHLQKTHEFFERYGGKTVILAMFVPIVRTFAPFVAGMGRMTYRKFMIYCIVGATAWIGIFVAGGFVFAGSKVVERHMPMAVLAVLVASMMPGAFEFAKHSRESRRAKLAAQTAGVEGSTTQSDDPV